MRRKPPDQAGPELDDASGTHEPHEGGRAPAEPGSPAAASAPTGNMTMGSPRPEASAREAHDPEPKPEKQADGEGEGTRPAGQGEETNPTKP